jgi:hypothetical protein
MHADRPGGRDRSHALAEQALGSSALQEAVAGGPRRCHGDDGEDDLCDDAYAAGQIIR